MKKWVLIISVVLTGCVGDGTTHRARQSLFVGIDVSGSFYNSGRFEEAIEFLSYYLYGHLHRAGDLKPLKSLFVGSVGGKVGDEVKSFRPIHDFENKTVDEIKADLIEWFPKSDTLTDFNVFFKSVENIAKKRNLALAPITILLLSDGKPDFPGIEGDPIANVDMSGLEYLSRNVTVRLLYAGPVESNKWEVDIPRKRVRMWTADQKIMEGWKQHLDPALPVEKQDELWRWVKDNIDYRVRRSSSL